MKKLLIWILALILLVSSVFSLCDLNPIANETCEMQTPYLGCSANYTLINSVGVTETGKITLINNNIYKFNFTNDIGNYTLILCDNTTKNIEVVVEDNMIGESIAGIGLIIGYLSFVGILLFLFTKLNDEKMPEFVIYKFFIIGFILFTSIFIPKAILDMWTLEGNTAVMFFNSVIWFMRVITGIIFINIVWRLFRSYEVISKVVDGLRK